MKKFHLFLFILLTGSSYSIKAQLFEENMITVGATYGFDFEKIGVTIGGKTLIGDHFGVEGNVIYFKYDSDYAAEINLNGTYSFTQNDIKPYLLLGLSMSNATYSLLGDRNSSRKFGANIGGGLEYSLEKISFFIEPKYTIGGYNQFYATLGIRVNL